MINFWDKHKSVSVCQPPSEPKTELSVAWVGWPLWPNFVSW